MKFIAVAAAIGLVGTSVAAQAGNEVGKAKAEAQQDRKGSKKKGAEATGEIPDPAQPKVDRNSALFPALLGLTAVGAGATAAATTGDGTNTPVSP